MGKMDVAPNFANTVMGIKDKVFGEPHDYKAFHYPEKASPADIDALFTNQIESLKTDIPRTSDDTDKFDKQMKLYWCIKGKNVTSAIRLNGPTALVSQKDRSMAAYTAAQIIWNEGKDKNGNYDEEKTKAMYNTDLHLAAALGHRKSIRALKNQARLAKQQQ